MSSIEMSPPVSPLRQEAFEAGHIAKGAKIHFKIGKRELPWFAQAVAPSTFCFAVSDHNGTHGNQDCTYSIGFGYNGHLSNAEDSVHIRDEFRKDLRPGVDIDAYLTHDWTADPYSKGTWAFLAPGSAGRYLKELQQPHRLVTFASSDWADGWRGFIDGAIEQGIRAGHEIRKTLLSEQSVRDGRYLSKL